MKKVYFLFAGALLLAASVFAQAPEPPLPGPGAVFFQKSDGEAGAKVRSSFNYVYGGIVTDKQELVKNAPYTATAVTESTQVLADGNRIVNKTSGLVARDSEGRSRREMMVGIGSLPVGLPKTVMISDPVSMTNYVLNPEEKTAHVMKFGNFAFAINEQGGEGVRTERRLELQHKMSKEVHKTEFGKLKGESLGEVKHEDLGTEVVEGVSCVGSRETHTIPAGAIGNERPLETTSETWTSPDLHLVVLSKHNDPRFGETTYRLTDLRRGEPDASLFQVPSEYKVAGPPEPGSPPPLPPPPSPPPSPKD